MAKIRISAYTDKLSVKPGDTLQVMASADGTERVRAELVRLIHGDEHPDGPGFVEQKLTSEVEHDWPVRKQYVQKGNFLRVAIALLRADTNAKSPPAHAPSTSPKPAQGRRGPPSHSDVPGPSRFDGALGTPGPRGLARDHFRLSEVCRRDRPALWRVRSEVHGMRHTLWLRPYYGP
jgi:hypothetical protein